MRIGLTQFVVLLAGATAACSASHHDPRDQKDAPQKAGVAASAVNAVGPIDPSDGYPRYYEDTAGVRVQQCNDTTDPNCAALLGATPTFSLALPTVFTTNFPEEFFYAYAASNKVLTPGCAAAGGNPATNPGIAFSLAAVEGAFANGAVKAGDQIAFGRIRIVASGLCPFTAYDFTHPYGTERVTTNGLGQVTANIKGFTEDIGCKGTPCNFTLPYSTPIAGPPPSTGSRVFGNFAQWNPAESAPPAGYLGNPATPHTIIGTPNNIFEVRSVGGGNPPKGSGNLLRDVTGAIPATTAQFAVMGKLAGDLTAPLLGFGAQAVGVLSAARTVTLTNWSPSPITVSALALAGTDAADFAITGNTCIGVALARDATCTVSGTFTPSALGNRNAQIDVTATRADAVAPLPLSVPLKGTGVVAGALAAATFDTAALAFGNVRVNSFSNAQTVTLTNTGNAPMQVIGVANTGPSSADYSVLQDTCANSFQDPGASCFVTVRVSPAATGSRTSSLVFTDDAPGSPHSIALTASGTGGLNGVAATFDTNGYPNWYRDDNGIQVRPCYDQIPDPLNPGQLLIDPLCLLPPADTGWDPTLALAPFGNFPGEAFYYAATATLLNLPGCPDQGIPTGKSVLLEGLESTFVTGVPIAGDQITFGRKRIVVQAGLCPNTNYQFTYPYGTEVLMTDAAGSIKANRKIDTGCLTSPCNFSAALADPIFGGLLRWTDGDGTIGNEVAPPGYLGDPLTLHRVTGGLFTAPGENAPVDYYRISTMDGTLVAQTNLWAVTGKTAVVRGAPAPVAFPARSVGGAGPAQTVTLTNVDPANAITLTSVVLGGTNPGDFATTNDTCTGVALTACPLAKAINTPAACPATSKCTVDVSFSPLALGEREATLIGNHSGAASNPMTVLVSGLAGTPGVSFTPGGGVLFDDQPNGTDSYPHDVEVHNSGNAPLIIPAAAVTITGANAAEFDLTADGCSGTTVPAGGACSINVTFSPSVLGTLAGTLNLNSNAPGAPHSIPLTGKSLTPATGIASPAPLAIAFSPPSFLWGTSSDASPVVITNVGGAPLTIHHLAVVGQHPFDFAVSNDLCTAAVIPVGATCSFNAQFNPKGSGARSGIVNIYDATGNNTLATVALAGTGTKPIVAPPAVPAFGGAAGVLFNTTVSQTITISNTGDGNLIVPAGGLTVTGANAAEYVITATTCTAGPVAPGGNCTATIAFTPQQRGVRTASLNVAANTAFPGPGTTAIALTGTCNAPILSYSSLTFGNQRVGTTSTKGVNITNAGNTPLTIGPLGVRVTPAADFFVVAGSSNKCTAGTVIQPGKSCSFNLTFAPTALGQRSGNVSTNSNDPAGVAGEKVGAATGNGN